ncbi:MAG TPA: VWA-like domain-containing protein [Candidatus Paceibacterota bacterium]|nr:VWA-like domain-containing protein [Candidatus Paceibacterota bacterium]
MGLINFSFPEKGPAPAWTGWDEKARVFKISILRELAEQASPSLLGMLIEHEANHIACQHFKIECMLPDRLIAGDVEANGWMRRRGTYDPLQKGLSRVLGDGKLVDPVEVLTELGLDTERVYRADIIHDMIHDGELEELIKQLMTGSNMCGGIEHVDDDRAAAIGGVVAAAMPDAEARASGRMWGTEPGEGRFSYAMRPTPPWAEKLMEFARAVIETTLSDGRKHARPIPSLRQLGVHVPSIKPRWGHKPKKACLMVDVSGSMWWGNILGYLASAVKYLRTHNVNVHFIACDTRIVMDEELTDGLPQELPGGGGTDIVPLFDRARELKVEAAICVTDCELPHWPDKPPFETLWIVPAGQHVPFGEVAFYSEEE